MNLRPALMEKKLRRHNARGGRRMFAIRAFGRKWEWTMWGLLSPDPPDNVVQFPKTPQKGGGAA